MTDLVIVGSGPAGTAAALGCAAAGIRPLMLDVGVRRPEDIPRLDAPPEKDRHRRDRFFMTIGKDYEGLSPLFDEPPLPLKLIPPNMNYVTRGGSLYAPIEMSDYQAIQSFAMGGLANAWSAGLYRYTSEELALFPFSIEELIPHYDALSREFHIQGAEDDLSSFFGRSPDLLAPAALSRNLNRLLERYRARHQEIRKRGIFIGHARVAVVERNENASLHNDPGNPEYWQDQPNIYTPVVTLKRLIRAGLLEYRDHVLVKSWQEKEDSVRIIAEDTRSRKPIDFIAGKLILAAGAINTAKIVLSSFRDRRSRLPLLDNPTLQIPLVLSKQIGRIPETGINALTRLNLIWCSEEFEGNCQGTIMDLAVLRRAEFLGRLPFSVRGNLALTKTVAPAMLGMQLFLPSHCLEPARLSLEEDGCVNISGPANRIRPGRIQSLIKILRSIGAWSHCRLVASSLPGAGIHYAGTLPMSRQPRSNYQCHPDGRLNNTRNIFIADGSVFPSLPAKNLSFTIMAIARRVAAGVAERLKESR